MRRRHAHFIYSGLGIKSFVVILQKDLEMFPQLFSLSPWRSQVSETWLILHCTFHKPLNAFLYICIYTNCTFLWVLQKVSSFHFLFRLYFPALWWNWVPVEVFHHYSASLAGGRLPLRIVSPFISSISIIISIITKHLSSSSQLKWNRAFGEVFHRYSSSASFLEFTEVVTFFTLFQSMNSILIFLWNWKKEAQYI